MTGEVLFSVREVSQKLGGAQILDRVSFDVHDRTRAGQTTGQIIGILGPSGVGKTRLIRIIAALDAPDSGSVVGIQGAPIEPGQVGVVFQDYPLLRHRTVRSNLEVAGIANGLSRAAAQGRAKKLLDLFRLGDRGSYYPAQLSGGQRQRVAIAQQIVCPKRLLLMDEPFSGLDPSALEEVMHLVVEVANMDELNTIGIVTHDIRAAMAVSDTLFMLGRDRTPDGKWLPGARIQETYDLVERGLAWRDDVMELPAFSSLEKEIRQKFKQL
ncbi:MAG: ABC transporter ATP-binding protein [Myxococcales bacterium]|nr:ABC transporter ATP-binding protein [Myxococcales bacterium]